jgi:AcrR family transcriptional regulator
MKDNPGETKKNILSSARKEFIEKGYVAASLRTIASNADVTTGALYRHFKDKDALFSALVGDTVDAVKKMLENAGMEEVEFILGGFPGGSKAGPLDNVFEKLVAYIYDRFDIFTLLLTGASGSSYENFLQEMTDLYADLCLDLVQQLHKKKFITARVDKLTVHVIASSFVISLKELILHRIPQNKAAGFLSNIHTFYHYGWMHLFGIPCEEKDERGIEV